VEHAEPCDAFARKPERKWGPPDHAAPRAWDRTITPPRAWRAVDPPQSVVHLAPASVIEEAIEGSKWILALEADWDDAGARPVSRETWLRAASFVRALERTSRQFGRTLKAPTISACADGSIDVMWRTGQFKLLVNMQPSDGGDFYGESMDGVVVKGPLLGADIGVLYALLDR
jgi:hypothetical protein